MLQTPKGMPSVPEKGSSGESWVRQLQGQEIHFRECEIVLGASTPHRLVSVEWVHEWEDPSAAGSTRYGKKAGGTSGWEPSLRGMLFVSTISNP